MKFSFQIIKELNEQLTAVKAQPARNINGFPNDKRKLLITSLKYRIRTIERRIDIGVHNENETKRR